MNRQPHFRSDPLSTSAGRSIGRIFRNLSGSLVLFASLVLTVSAATSQGPSGYWHEARSIAALDLRLASLEGMVYEPSTGAFLIFGESVSSAGGARSFTRMNMAGDALESFPATLSISAVSNAAIDPLTGELLILGSGAPVAGNLMTRSLAPHSLGVSDPRGIAVDAANSRLFILDANGLVVAPLASRANGADEGAETAGMVRHLVIDAAAVGDLRGLAYNPANDHLYIAAPDRNRIYELTTDARLIAELDVAELRLTDPRGLVVAPSGDPTDDAAVMSLYVADRGPSEVGQGKVVELYLVDPRQSVPTMMISLAAAQVRITRTSVWSPPSPDPSGIDFHPKLNRLLISDGEVDEMAIFQNRNFFQARTSGVLARSCNLTGFTTEPAGVAVNPANGGTFISDDNADTVFAILAGPDAKFCTSDDTRTSINTRVFNSFDPEGVAFGQGMLFVSDGEGAEVTVITPGANGKFDGLPPAGDDVINKHFDTASLGIRDPEGIGYDAQRGTLFITSRLERNSLFEVSISGKLLNTYDISVLNATLPAGVGVGPASQNPARTSIYIVDRGIDNDVDPDENDGMLYEVTLDSPPSPTGGPIYLSHEANTSSAFPGLSQTGDEDILYFNGNTWSIYVDGSDVGLAGLDLNAFTLIDADTILMSFAQPASIGNLGKVDDSDIVRFDATSLGNNTAGTFSLYFDGSDVGLANASEDIDALDLLPDGRLILSTLGAYAVPGANGKGNNLLRFTPTSLGITTTGAWALYFDGRDVGITPTANVDGVSVDPQGDIFLSAANNFSLAGQMIGDEDVFICVPASLGSTTACNFASTLYFDGSAWGVAADDIDAVHIP